MSNSARWLIEFTGESPEGVTETFRFSDGSYYESGDTVAWIPQLSVAGMFSESFFAGDILPSYKSGLGFSEIVNTTGSLDYLNGYAFDGRVLTVYRVTSEGKEVYGYGAIKQLTFTTHIVTVQILDIVELLGNKLPFQTYLGTNYYGEGDLKGVEGTKDDLKGNVKPKLYGEVSQASPILVNSALLIYQVADSDCTITGVFDGGVALGVGSPYSSLVDMYNNQPSAGTYRKFEGYIRLGASLVSTITVNAKHPGGCGLGTVFKRIVEDYESYSPLTVNQESVDALDLAYGGVNCYLTDEVAAVAVLDALVESIGGGWSVNKSGEVWAAEITPPDLNTDQRLHDYSIVKFNRSESGVKGVPVFKVEVNYDKVFTVQGQLLGSASEEFSARVSMEYRKVSSDNSATKARHPLSTELTLHTLLVLEDDATSVADHVASLVTVRREVLDIEAVINFNQKPQVLSSIIVFHYRFYPEGKPFLIVSSSIDSVKNTIHLKLWG